MYEGEKEKLKSFFSINEEEKLNYLQIANNQLAKACERIFKDQSHVMAAGIIRATSVWAMKCDGLCNDSEIKFLNKYFRKRGINETAQRWISLNVTEAQAEVEAAIVGAQLNASLDRNLQNEYYSLAEAIGTIFIIYATADKIVTDTTGKAFAELRKLVTN